MIQQKLINSLLSVRDYHLEASLCRYCWLASSIVLKCLIIIFYLSNSEYSGGFHPIWETKVAGKKNLSTWLKARFLEAAIVYCFRNIQGWAGKTAQWLRACTALQFPALTLDSSQPPITPALHVQNPSSGLVGTHTYMYMST